MHRHDALWKGLLQTFFPQFLELVVPELAIKMRPEKRRFLEKEAFTDPPEGQKALLDLVAEVPAKHGPDEVILVHVEVERDFGSSMDRRMWRYFFHLSLKYAHPIIPIVLFLRGGQGGVTERSVEHRAAGFLINRFTYFSLGLSGHAAEAFLETPPLGIALAACARGDRLPRYEQKYRCLEALLDCETDEAQRELLMTAVETYLTLNEEEKMKYAERMEESTRKQEVQALELTWAGRLHAKGFEEGSEKGRREGRRDGRLMASRRMLGMIVAERFGDPPATVTEAIERMEDPQRIEELGRRALEAKNLAEIAELIDS